MRITAFIICIFAATFISGCVTRVADLTMITTKNVGNKVDLTKAMNLGKVEGSDTKPIIIVFPTGVPNTEEAIDRALEEVGGDFLTDAVMYHEFFYIPYLFGAETRRVTGTAWRTENYVGYSPTLEEIKKAREEKKARRRQQYDDNY